MDINFYGLVRHLIRGAFDLWPLILIILGINIIFKKELLNTLLWVLFLVIVIVYSLFIKDDILYNNNIVNKSPNDKVIKEVNTVELREGLRKAKLNLDIGAVSFNVKSIEDYLLNLDQDGSFDFKLDNDIPLENVYISNKFTFRKGVKASRFNIDINENIPWDFNIDMGAGTGKLDLQEIMVENMELDMGAGDIEINFGNKLGSTYIDVDAGASSIKINLPEQVGIKIDFDGGLSSTNFDRLGITKVESGKYISENYEAAGTRFQIDVDMGVGSFEINYY